MRARLIAGLFLAALVAGLCLAGCAPAASPPSPPATQPTGSTTPTSLSPATPGSLPDAGYAVDGDLVVVRGWLSEIDIEGGTWIIDSMPPTSSAMHATLAVLVDGKIPVVALSAYRGGSDGMGFVEIRGRKGADVSSRMAGPEVRVDEVIVF